MPEWSAVRRVGVVGAAGRMGARATVALSRAEGLDLTALVGPHPGEPVPGAVWATSLDALDPGLVDVVVDLTRPEVARATLRWVAQHRKDAVIGTSGLTDEDLERCRDEVTTSHVLVVPNFSIGAVLLQRFAAEAAPHFAAVEIVELHHDEKRDAPSGTAVATATALAAARAAAGQPDLADRTTTETLAHARGASGPGGVRVHAVRLPGLLAHQEVLFGAPGEGLTLRHDTYDRSAFMGGLVLAVRRIDRVEGVQVGLGHVLDA